MNKQLTIQEIEFLEKMKIKKSMTIYEYNNKYACPMLSMTKLVELGLIELHNDKGGLIRYI